MKNFFWIPTVLLLSGITTITILKGEDHHEKAIYRFTSPARNFCTKAGQYLRNQRGDFYISDGVKIIIAVVLGALLLAALTTISTIRLSLVSLRKLKACSAKSFARTVIHKDDSSGFLFSTFYERKIAI